MDNWKIRQNVDLARGCSPLRIWPDALMFEGNENAHTWEIQIMNDGKPADLDGATCVVHFMRERDGENEDVICSGSVAGNVASVKLKKECYVEGYAVGMFNLVSGGTTLTLSKLAFLIGKGPTGVIIDPGSIIGDLDTLIAQIDAMEKATDEANAAADRANEAADRAESTGGVTDEQVGNAVAAYMSEHPVEAGATAEQAAQIEANRQAIEDLQKSGTGAPGADGQDGVSPTVTIESIEGGHRVTITDANGTQSFDVMDGATGATGATGQAGADGKDGQDGVSPTVTVEAIEGGHRVTITDANGTQSFDVMDGVDGQDSAGGSGSSVELDTTLTQSGKAADAKAVGDKLSELNEAIDALAVSGLTPAQISALDGMFKVAAYIKSDVSAEYNAFKTAFGIEDSGEEPEEPGTPEMTLTSISATYSGGDVAVGTAVTDLSGIVVTAHYSDGSAEAVTGYTLSGAIAEGENTITVSYGGKTTTFTVTGVTESDGVYVPELAWTDGQRINSVSGKIQNADGWSVCQLIDISDYTRIHVTTTSNRWFSANVFVGTNEYPKTALRNGTSYWGGSYMTDETFDISNYSYLRIESSTNSRNTFTVELS